MTTKEIMDRAHAEAQRRGIPVVQVLAEQVVDLRIIKNRDVTPSAKVVFSSDFALHVFDEPIKQSQE